MKKVLILTDADFVGGAETNYKLILPQLLKNGWEPIFLSSGGENLSTYFSRQGITVNVLSVFHKYFSFSVNNRVSPLNIFRTWLAVLKNRAVLKKLIRRHHPSAIVSNSMVSHWLLSFVNTGPECRKIMHLHDIIDQKKAFGLYGRYLHRIARRMDAVIVVSDPVGKQFSPGLQRKIKKMYNPAEAPSYTVGDRSRDTIRIGMFARYTPWKGHRDLLEIAKALPPAGYQFACFGNYAGNESYYEALKQAADALPNAPAIQFNGFCYDTALEMASCDIILQLSLLPDPAPKIMVEANLCHVPVYAYEGGGVREQFEALALAGVLVPSGDRATMIREIENFRDRSFVFPGLEQLAPEIYCSKFEQLLTGS